VLKKWVEANYEELPKGVVDLLLAFVRGRLLRQRHPAYGPMVRFLLISFIFLLVSWFLIVIVFSAGPFVGHVHHAEGASVARRGVGPRQHFPSAAARPRRSAEYLQVCFFFALFYFPFYLMIHF
jgi:hypothetical protein